MSTTRINWENQCRMTKIYKQIYLTSLMEINIVYLDLEKNDSYKQLDQMEKLCVSL